MKPPCRQFLYLAVGVATLLAVACVATAQTYPTRPISLVVPFAVGGPSDVIGRIFAERMRQAMATRSFSASGARMLQTALSIRFGTIC